MTKKLFFLLVLLIPVNLGKHFILKDSYVLGYLVDYLVPTIFIQDILVFALLVSWVLDSGLPTRPQVFAFFNNRVFAVLTLFLFVVFLSTLSALHFLPAFVAFLRLALYAGLMCYSYYQLDLKTEALPLLKILLCSVVLLSLLGIFQYLKQGSVFNNYLVLGEQPYSVSTQGISRESLFGITKVGSYGLFRHPNVYGAFLCLGLTTLLFFAKKTKVLVLALLIGFIALLTTFSTLSIVAFIVGGLAYILARFARPLRFSCLARFARPLRFAPLPCFARPQVFLLFSKTHTSILCLCLLILLPMFLLLLPLPPALLTSASIVRRYHLLQASFGIFIDHPLFGVGYNNVTYVIEKYSQLPGAVRFVQPVHNLFMLVACESGIFALLLLMALLIFVLLPKLLATSKTNLSIPLSVLCFQALFLAGFDHYFLTSHQMLLVFFIGLGLMCPKAVDNHVNL